MTDIPDETEVGIVGAGPAGLVLSHLLARGIDCVVLEQRDRAYVEHRVRAGVLEHPTVELLRDARPRRAPRSRGPCPPRHRAGLRRRRHRIDFVELTGRSITVYGQQEVVKDLIAARLAAGDPIVFEALDVAPADVDDRPSPSSATATTASERELRCRVVAGCDGFARRLRPGRCPDRARRRARRTRSPGSASWPRRRRRRTSWSTPATSAASPCTACARRRSPACTCRSRPTSTLADWSDDRIWDELATRLPTADGFALNTGPILERASPRCTASVATPMRHGNLLLAGDAAHIVPATGAKGMNLAIADVAVHGRRDRRRRCADGRRRAARRVHADVPAAGCGGRSTSRTG